MPIPHPNPPPDPTLDDDFHDLAIRATTPHKSSRRAPHSTLREIKGLRNLIRQTESRLKDGSLDFPTGASLLTRSYNTLSRLLATDHHLDPPQKEDLPAEFQALMRRLLISMGRGASEDYDTP